MIQRDFGDEQPESFLAETARKCAESIRQYWNDWVFGPSPCQRPDESAEDYRERINVQ